MDASRRQSLGQRQKTLLFTAGAIARTSAFSYLGSLSLIPIGPHGETQVTLGLAVGCIIGEEP